MTDKQGVFNKDFFDSGVDDPDQPGRISVLYKITNILPEFEFLADQLKKTWKPLSVLDIGCAKGFLVLALRNIGIESYGVDVSEYALSQAPNQVSSYLTKIDLEKEGLPFSSGRFDLVTMFEVVEFVGNYDLVFQEIRRVIKNDGILVMKTAYITKPWDKIRVNVHEKDFWSKELDSYGFRLDPKSSRTLCQRIYVAELERILYDTGSGWKIRIGRVMDKIPGIGRWLLMKFYSYRRRHMGILVFKAHEDFKADK